MDKLNYIQIGDRVEYETDGARYFGIAGSIELTAEKVYLHLQVPEGRREPTRLPLEAVLSVHRVVDGRHTTSTYFHEETGIAPLTECGDQQRQALRLRDYKRGEVAIYVQTERVPEVVAVLPLPFSVSAFPFSTLDDHLEALPWAIARCGRCFVLACHRSDRGVMSR